MNGQKALRIILLISSTWNQDTYQETWKDLNKIIQTKYAFII